jgi:hypothetical protein
MQAYRKLECMNCGIDDGTVCGAHANQLSKGKGMAIKATDLCASLCHTCHMAVDQGRSMSRSERVEVWQDAHVKTIKALVERGLWPAGLEIPQLTV